MTEKLYFADPITTDFSATVLESSQNEEGTVDIVLDKTYFYPTGGGQTHDKGAIAGQAIVDVRKDGDTVIHVLEGQAIAEGEIVACHVDVDYRRGNTQAHTDTSDHNTLATL